MAKDNPFIVGKYLAPEYFCDREEETTSSPRPTEHTASTTSSSPSGFEPCTDFERYY